VRPRDEQAFTLIELLIVLVIVAVLMAIVLPSFGSTKDAANRGKVTLVAQSYDQAMSSFASDHMGKIPKPGTADWPSIPRGPLEPATRVGQTTGQAYLRSVPESVNAADASAGDVTLLQSSPAAGGSTGGKLGTVAIVVAPGATPTQYRVEVWAAQRGNFPAKATCVLGTYQVPSGVPKC
jgi:prepilin-type N-terminal cleavage/methylation domain-containing protein